jgi:hypothetical protein
MLFTKAGGLEAGGSHLSSSLLRGRDQEDPSFKASPGQIVCETLSQKQKTKTNQTNKTNQPTKKTPQKTKQKTQKIKTKMQTSQKSAVEWLKH